MSHIIDEIIKLEPEFRKFVVTRPKVALLNIQSQLIVNKFTPLRIHWYGPRDYDNFLENLHVKRKVQEYTNPANMKMEERIHEFVNKNLQKSTVLKKQSYIGGTPQKIEVDDVPEKKVKTEFSKDSKGQKKLKTLNNNVRKLLMRRNSTPRLAAALSPMRDEPVVAFKIREVNDKKPVFVNRNPKILKKLGAMNYSPKLEAEKPTKVPERLKLPAKALKMMNNNVRRLMSMTKKPHVIKAAPKLSVGESSVKPTKVHENPKNDVTIVLDPMTDEGEVTIEIEINDELEDVNPVEKDVKKSIILKKTCIEEPEAGIPSKAPVIPKSMMDGQSKLENGSSKSVEVERKLEILRNSSIRKQISQSVPEPRVVKVEKCGKPTEVKENPKASVTAEPDPIFMEVDDMKPLLMNENVGMKKQATSDSPPKLGAAERNKVSEQLEKPGIRDSSQEHEAKAPENPEPKKLGTLKKNCGKLITRKPQIITKPSDIEIVSEEPTGTHENTNILLNPMTDGSVVPAKIIQVAEDVKPVYACDVLKTITEALEHLPMGCGTDKEVFSVLKLKYPDISHELVAEVFRAYGESCMMKIRIGVDLTMWSSYKNANEDAVIEGYVKCVKKAIKLLHTPSSAGTSEEIFTRFVKIYDPLRCVYSSTIDTFLKTFAKTHFQVSRIGNSTIYSL